jgi:DNA repair protein RecN (Recombination protein N)
MKVLDDADARPRYGCPRAWNPSVWNPTLLTALAIRNVVLIEALDLAFHAGLGVLTGETGAGKSILLDSLGLVLGDRADTGLVRAGTDQASVTATFEFVSLPDAVRSVLTEAEIEIEPGEALIIKRRLRADGGSRAFINDQPVGVALLRDLSRALVELHGQHDDRGLVNARGHRMLLDRYARADVGAVAEAWQRWSRADAELAEARAAVAVARADEELLGAYLTELTALMPTSARRCKRANACRAISPRCKTCGRGRIRR